MTKPQARCHSRMGRALAMGLAVLLFVGMPAGLGVTEAAALTEQEINDKLDALEKEKEKLDQQIKENNGAIDTLQAQQNNLKEQADVVAQQINSVIDKLEKMDAELAAQDQAIAEKEQAIEDKKAANKENYDKLKKRMQAISKTGNLSSFQMLLNTEDYTDYLIKSKLMERIAENDQKLIDTIDDEIRALNEEKQQLSIQKDASAAQKVLVEKIKEDNVSRKNQLDALYKQIHKNELDLQNRKKI